MYPSFNPRSSIVVFLAVGAALSLALSGCDEPKRWDKPGPEAEFEKFLRHWFENRREKAFEMIDPKDRRRLERPVKELEDELQNVDLFEANEMLVAGRVDNPYDVKSIEVEPKLESKPSTGDRFRLTLTYQDGDTGSATMVWRGDGWYVDLPLEFAAEGASEREAYGRPRPSPSEDRTGDTGTETSRSAEVAEPGHERRD